MYSNVSTKEKLVHFGLKKNSCEQLSFHIGMGSERHNDAAYCDLCSTFLVDEFAFKSHL